MWSVFLFKQKMLILYFFLAAGTGRSSLRPLVFFFLCLLSHHAQQQISATRTTPTKEWRSIVFSGAVGVLTAPTCEKSKVV
jgi:hypothetical protein